jgi:hypothetical protein
MRLPDILGLGDITGVPYLIPLLVVSFATVLSIRLKRNKLSAKQPPLVPYFLPWIGSALEIGKDADGFFRRVK